MCVSDNGSTANTLACLTAWNRVAARDGNVRVRAGVGRAGGLHRSASSRRTVEAEHRAQGKRVRELHGSGWMNTAAAVVTLSLLAAVSKHPFL
jgi:hypothetical protein